MRLLFFKAPWCTVCHAIETTVPEYCVPIDCNIDQETPAKYSICSLPTFIAVQDDGTEVARIQSSNVRMLDKWYEALGGKREN